MQCQAVAALPACAGARLRRGPPPFTAAASAVPRRFRAVQHIACSAEPPKQQDAAPAAAPAEGAAADGSVRDALQAAEGQQGGKRRRAADSSDFMATALTRRFGLAGGLAWVGFLAFGVIGEQVKTRLEIASEEANTREVSDAAEVVTPEGLRITDLKIGGGSPPVPGYIMVLDYKAYARVGDGPQQLFEDTTARGKPIVFLYGKRPLSGGVCPGVEKALATMRAGGRRRVVIPPELGFGERGLTLRPTEHVPEKQGVVPPGAKLEYELTLVRVSIPPS